MATILVVEDRDVDREFLTTLLGYRGHRVVAASDGLQALDVVERTRPDLVISDILMPSVDGYELVRRLRDMPFVGATPVMFYTATYHEREARALATQCGVVDILTKPSDPEVILARIDELLRQPRVPEAPLVPASFHRAHAAVLGAKLDERERKLTDQKERMASLVALCRDLTIERDPPSVLSLVCKEARAMMLAQVAAIGLLSDDGVDARVSVASGAEIGRLGALPRHAIDDDTLRRVVERREAVRRSDASGDTRTIGLNGTATPVFSYLAVPLASPTRIYGWLGFRNKLGASAFTFEDEQLALMLGIQTAIAYENALRFQALEQAKRRTEFAMRAAEMGIWEIDSTSGRVTWSEPMPAVVGIPAEHMPTSVVELLELVHPDDRERMEAEIRKVLVDGTPLAIDARALTADGGVRWIAGRARAVVEDGQVRGLLGVAINIDERKHLEAQLRQAQKMDAIGQLAGGVAHDFNNLLTVIKGYAEFLRDESVDEAQKTDADEILVASDRAAALTRQLLMFSRQQRVERRIVDLNDQLEKVSKMLRRLVGERFTIDLDLAGDLAPVYADANQLDQVVMNLVVNARDAMLLGGAITIGAGPLAAAAGAFGAGPAEAGPFVHLWVRDTGSGMTDEVRARLFEPFFTTKSRGAGTGLGLATVHGIVVESGGYITVDSAPGAGTTIHVYLPAASGTSAAPPAPPARARVATGTVLLVEDEPAVRQVAERVLQGVGYDVFSVESADAARRVFETRRIDLLLTDVIMPGCSGPALYRELSKTCPGLRVMYMSGYTDDAITGNDIDDDTPLVRKPFAAEELAGKVQEAMGR